MIVEHVGDIVTVVVWIVFTHVAPFVLFSILKRQTLTGETSNEFRNIVFLCERIHNVVVRLSIASEAQIRHS